MCNSSSFSNDYVSRNDMEQAAEASMSVKKTSDEQAEDSYVLGTREKRELLWLLFSSEEMPLINESVYRYGRTAQKWYREEERDLDWLIPAIRRPWVATPADVLLYSRNTKKTRTAADARARAREKKKTTMKHRFSYINNLQAIPHSSIEQIDLPF